MSRVNTEQQNSPIHPLQYLSESTQGRHDLILFENEHRATILQYWFLLHGLVKKENCVHASSQSFNHFKESMRKLSQSRDYFEDKNQRFKILELEPIRNSSSIPSLLNAIHETMASNSKFESTRMVLNLFNEEDLLTDPDLARLCAEVEKDLQSTLKGHAPFNEYFSEFKGMRLSMLCYHRKPRDGSILLRDLVSSHDKTIFVSESGESTFVNIDGGRFSLVKES